jgi:hypothetical protein
MHGLEDEQSAFTLLVPPFQRSLFATPCAQSATPSGSAGILPAFFVGSWQKLKSFHAPVVSCRAKQ